MRQLTKRERKLAIAIGAALFLAANLFGVNALWQKLGEFRENVGTLREESADADSWLAEKEQWQQRKTAMDKMQPVLKSTGEADAELIDTLVAGAQEHSITVIDRGFVEPDNARNPYYQPVAVKLKISGTREAVARWLWDIQKPENFQAIPSLSMKIDTDPEKVICELVVARYYAPAE